jgi:hypothetical protein
MEPFHHPPRAAQGQVESGSARQAKSSLGGVVMACSALYIGGMGAALAIYAMASHDRELLLRIWSAVTPAVDFIMVWGSGSGVLEALRRMRSGDHGSSPHTPSGH